MSGTDPLQYERKESCSFLNPVDAGLKGRGWVG